MKISETSINGAFVIENFCSSDMRGEFVKLFNNSNFGKFKLFADFKESYYSISQKNVIRGMHFQMPPDQHAKLVHVPAGAIMDVVLDLRKESATFKKCFSIELNAKNKNSIYIPEGCAHGFLSLVDETITLYHVTTEYQPDSDAGILWSSIPFDWNIKFPIVSKRDDQFIPLTEFVSPF